MTTGILIGIGETRAERIEALEAAIQILLLPKDAADDRSAMLEVRAGTGGDEAALFAGDLFRMYQRYAATQGWRVEVDSVSEGEMGGYKEIIASVTGDGVFGRLKFESGVHRVQRVPETEAGGRIHTSAATVAVLPEAEEFADELAEGFVQALSAEVVGGGFQHQTFGAGRQGKVARRVHQQSANAATTGGRCGEQVAEQPGAVGIDGRERRIQLHETQRFGVFILCEENSRLVAGHALGDEGARLLKVRRLLIETAIGVEQFCHRLQMSRRSAKCLDGHVPSPPIF